MGRIVKGFVCACLMSTGVAYGTPVVWLTSDSVCAEGDTMDFWVSVLPHSAVEKVVLTFEGESGEEVDTTYPYEFPDHVFNTAMAGLTVTATASFTDGTPDVSRTKDIDVLGIDISISGPTSPLRGWNVAYIAQSNPPGWSISWFGWTYEWGAGSNAFEDNDTDDDDRSVWAGKMVASGTLACTATIGGRAVSKSLPITVVPRTWALPISCAQDNESGWGEIPTLSAALGQNRDRDSDNPFYVLVPRDSEGSFLPAYTLAQVSTGPCEGLWYVSSSILKCQRETVINTYIKENGPLPPGASENFFTVNDPDCLDPGAADFVQAVMDHEYRGTPDTFRSIGGHQGRIEDSIYSLSTNPKQAIEGLVGDSQEQLEIDIDNVLIADEADVADFALDESYMDTYGPNWGGVPEEVDPLGWGMHHRWDEGSTAWTANCNSDPAQF